MEPDVRRRPAARGKSRAKDGERSDEPMHDTLPVAAALLGQLEKMRVGFAHWKSNLRLAGGLAGATDLDLLVDRRDAASFSSVVTGLNGQRIISQPWASYPGVEDWLILDPAKGSFLHLHVHFDLVTGLKRVKHLCLPWSAQVLADVRKDPRTGWPIPAPEMELLLLLIRIWAKMPPFQRLFGARIPAHVVAELRWLEAQCEAEDVRALAASLGLSADVKLPFAGQAEILHGARHLYGQVRPYYRMSWPRALVRSALLHLRLAAVRMWLTRIGPIRYGKLLDGQGAMIALIGTDGSGKSTVSRALLEWLQYKLDVHLIYMGSGDDSAGWLNRLRRGLSRSWRESGVVKAARVPKADAPRPATFAEKSWRLFDFLLLRRKLRLLRLGRRVADRGGVVLLDRYPQDQFNGISDGPRQQDGGGFGRVSRAERNMFAEARSLGPDLAVKLSVDPVTAHGRKPDHDIEMIRWKSDIIDRLRFPEAEVVVIDAGAAPEAVLLAAKTAIWHRLRRPARR